MNKKLENLVDLIFTKLKEYKSKEISIEKEELKNFIISLLKERWIKDAKLLKLL